jgi:hypothetical protein
MSCGAIPRKEGFVCSFDADGQFLHLHALACSHNQQPDAVAFWRYFPIFPKQPRFVLYILQPAGILVPSI